MMDRGDGRGGLRRCRGLVVRTEGVDKVDFAENEVLGRKWGGNGDSGYLQSVWEGRKWSIRGDKVEIDIGLVFRRSIRRR